RIGLDAVARCVDSDPQPEETTRSDRIQRAPVCDGDDDRLLPGCADGEFVVLTTRSHPELHLAGRRSLQGDLADDAVLRRLPMRGHEPNALWRGAHRHPHMIAL